MTNIVLTGTEVLQVLPIQSNGQPAATTGQTTVGDIAALSPGTLASGKILVGSAGNLATARTMSGDATISNTGVVTTAGISTVIVTAKLTGGGANGSMTFVDGLLTVSTPAT